MHRLSTVQILSLWTDLWQAYYRDHGFGTDTAEIYTYRLMPFDPMYAEARTKNPQTAHGEPGAMTGLERDAYEEGLRNAMRSLYSLLQHFEHTVSDAKIFVDGKRIGVWMNKLRENHRLNVRVERTKR